MLISDGFEEIEALGTVDILRRCEAEVSLVSVTGNDVISSSRNLKIIADGKIEDTDANPALWDAVILPGGQPNADNLRDNDKVIEIVKDFYNAGKLTCAICAAPIAFEKAGILDGKKATCYPGCFVNEKASGYTGNAVEKDGNVITANGPASACSFAFEIAKALGLKEKAEAVREGMLFTSGGIYEN